MTPAVVPMHAGERPTEPGWYVIQKRDGERDFVRGWRYDYEAEGISEFIVGSTGEEIRASAMPHEDWTFIARIYPDRIEGREG